MLNKLYRQAFEAVNVTVGVSSLTAIAIGALTVFGSASLLGLNKIGIKTIPEKHIQQSLEIGMASTIAGSVGFFAAITAAAGFAGISSAVDKDDESEPITSHSTNSVVLNPSISHSDNANSLYLYQIMRITGYRYLENKLIVARVEDKQSRKIVKLAGRIILPGRFHVIYDWLNSESQDYLMELFDICCNEEKLIGKAFSSSQVNPKHAIREFIDFYRPQLEFKSSCDEFSFNLKTCVGCRNFHGASNIVCGIHPYGWERDENCPDWESNQRNQRVYFPFERQGVINQLNHRIEQNQACLLKNDDGTLTLWDDFTNRRFQFSWSGLLLDDSDRLVEIDRDGQLLDYIQYFSVRNVVKVDCSSKIDKLSAPRYPE